MTRATRAVIDLHALQHNLKRVRQLAPSSRVMAVIKANGYGHGLQRVARSLASADAFGVACMEEAVALRDMGVSIPILLLEGVTDDAELSLALRLNLDVVVHQQRQLDLMKNPVSGHTLDAWLKLDTGMHRLGFSSGELASAWQQLEASPLVNKKYLMTHLACGDNRESNKTIEQIDLFNTTVANIPGEFSIANSAGILGWSASHLQWVRPGIMLYGVSPFDNDSGTQQDLLPVMTLYSQLIAINHFKKGDTIGYGGTWSCPEDMPVGVVAIGYGDGYPRHAAAGTPVLVNGKRVPLIGRVSMDMITVDLRSQPQASIGDEVILWGKGLPVEEIAQHAGTIGYDLLCGVTTRVHMIEKETN
jgi:alanine racemase